MKSINLSRALVLALAGSVALSGCATVDQATQKVGGVFGSSNDSTRSATGGAILGCAAGALAGKLFLGGSSMLKGCAAGAVVGGVASYKIHQAELAKARALAQEAHASLGVDATVATRPVQAKDDAGKTVTTDTLDRLVLPLPAKDVLAHSARVSEILVKAANVADGSSSDTTLEVHGGPKERAWLGAQIRQDLKAGSTVKVVDVPDAKPSIVISPIPTAAK